MRPTIAIVLTLLAQGVSVTATRAAHAQTPSTMPPLSWLEIANTKLRSVVPKSAQEFPGTFGNTGPASIISAWNSATLDTRRSRLILHGGGHADYYGNELYAFDVGTLTWKRLTDPTPNPTAGTDINSDGTPQARHTYNGTTYISHLDRFFVFAGSGSTIGASGFPPTENVWTFDFGANQWSHVNTPPPDGPPHGEGSSAIYDPATRIVWYGEGQNSGSGAGWGLWAWNQDTRVWTHHTHESVFSRSTGCLDSKRGVLVFVGGGAVHTFQVRSGTPRLEDWTTTGDTAIINQTAPGVAYDPVLDRVIAWQGGPVYVLNPDTKEWRALDVPGAPTPCSNNTYGRFAYIPLVNAFASINDIDQNVFFFKHSAGQGQPPPPYDGGIDAGGQDSGNSGTAGTSGTSGTSGVGGTGPASGGTQGSGAAPSAGSPGSPNAGHSDGDASGCGCKIARASGLSSLAHTLVLLVLSLAGYAVRRTRRRPST